MTRKTKDERLKLNKFPPLTAQQKAMLADAQFEQAKRLRQGTYPAEEAIADLKMGNNANKPDPQRYQAEALMNRFDGDRLTRAKLWLEFAAAWGDGTAKALNYIFAWFERRTEVDDEYLRGFDMLVALCDSPLFPDDEALPVFQKVRQKDAVLGDAYISRCSYNLYDRVKLDESQKKGELTRFVKRVRTPETTERDANLVMAYFKLAMRLGDRQAAAAIAVNAPWRFAHEQIEAKYRLLMTNGKSRISHIQDRDAFKQSLRELRDKCLPHFLFTAACQVAEMTGEKEDLEFVRDQLGIHGSNPFLDTFTDEEVRLMARAFLASYNDPDHREDENEVGYNHDRMLMFWEDLVRVVYRCEKQQLVRDRFLTIFVIEAFKQRVLSDIELWDFVVSDLYGRSAVLPSSVALVAEAAGVESLPLLERAYALAQNKDLPLAERITALCRIAKLKKKFAMGEGKLE